MGVLHFSPRLMVYMVPIALFCMRQILDERAMAPDVQGL